MKNLILLFSLVFSSLVTSAQTMIFANEFQSFEINYPETWKLSEYIMDEVAFAAYNPHTITPAYHETVNVKVMNTYSSDLLLCSRASVDMLKERLQGFELLNTEETVIGGNHVIAIEYQHFIPKSKEIKKKIKLRSKTYILVKDRKEYLITYSADRKAFDQSFPEFKRMMESFRFIFKLNA